MTQVWPEKKLKEIASIRVSNVDKKTNVLESSVKLCNYMDVYSNDYITNKIQFMEATASQAEIERFILEEGDVIITKDSETPDDIGRSSVIMEEIKDLVCGYHLALIKPNKNIINSVYLSKQLSTSRVERYFALRASGSTRFGLSVSDIESVAIFLPSIEEQSEIAEILSTVDRVIEQTEALISKQQRIKTGLMQDLLCRGIDENGNIRTEQTHQFKNSPLGRIPIEWDIVHLGESQIDLVDGDRGENYPKQDDLLEDGYCLFLNAKNVTKYGFRFSETQFISKEKDKKLGSGKLKKFDIVITTRGTLGNFAFFDEKVPYDKIRINSGMIILRNRDPLFITEYIYESFRNFIYEFTFKRIVSGSAQPQLPLRDLKKFYLIKPTVREQESIISNITKLNLISDNLERQLSKWLLLKAALMQDLLTGKKLVTALLKKTEVVCV